MKGSTVVATLGQGAFSRVALHRVADWQSATTAIEVKEDEKQGGREDKEAYKNAFVAVKQYERDNVQVMGRSQRIMAEKEALQRLATPPCAYITRLLDTSKDDTYLYFFLDHHKHIQF